MTEPTIICPSCKSEVKLTESLAAPLLEATKREFEHRLVQKEAESAKREVAIREREVALAKSQEALDAQVAEKLKTERTRIVAEESKKAKLALTHDLEQKSKDLLELQGLLKQRDEKLADAQKAQADLLRKQRELDDAKRELDLTVEKRVQAGLTVTREQAKKEADEAAKLKLMEAEQTISAMQKQVEELKRKAEQGSQQLQGEVQELELEGLLTAKFPHDRIQPVPKGEHGGDVMQYVGGPYGQVCGSILWESKRTKNWTNTWLVKLREDQREAKAELAVIVSQTLPKDLTTFGLIDGIWVTDPQSAFPLAMALRHSLLEVALAKQANEGQQTKMEMVYDYLMGPRFRQRVEAIAEAFKTMQEDLDKERKVIMKQWAKREAQVDRVMQATVGMYGDLQGIAGKTLQEIEGLELKALDSPTVEQSTKD